MTYSPNIPQSGDRPSQSQSQLLTNFQQINSIFNANHVPFNDATVGNRGKHKYVSLLQQSIEPSAVANEAQLYTKSVGGVPAPTYRITNGIYSVPLVINAGDYTTSNGTTNTFDFTGQPAMMGTVLGIDPNDRDRTLFSPFYWTGTQMDVPGVAGQLSSGSTFVRFQDNSSGPVLQVVATAVRTIRIRIFGVII